MGDITLASQMDDESELFERFEEFKDERGHTNRSEALRAALRRGLDHYDGEIAAGDRRPYTRFEDLLLTAAAVIAGVTMLIPVFWLGGLLPAETAIAAALLYLGLSAAIALGVDLRARRAGSDSADSQEVSG